MAQEKTGLGIIFLSTYKGNFLAIGLKVATKIMVGCPWPLTFQVPIVRPDPIRGTGQLGRFDGFRNLAMINAVLGKSIWLRPVCKWAKSCPSPASHGSDRARLDGPHGPWPGQKDVDCKNTGGPPPSHRHLPKSFYSGRTDGLRARAPIVVASPPWHSRKEIFWSWFEVFILFGILDRLKA